MSHDAIHTKGPFVLAYMRISALVIFAIVSIWVGSLVRKERRR